jgi:hypothetical protein
MSRNDQLSHLGAFIRGNLAPVCMDRLSPRLVGKIVCIVSIVGLGFTASAIIEASTYPETPIPRLELGVHSDEIMQVVPVGADGLLTVSFDKTSRLWASSSGGLRHVWRTPDAGPQFAFDGWLYATAVSRDAKSAIIGGYLRPELGSSQRFSIFVIDLRHPELTPRPLDGFQQPSSTCCFPLTGGYWSYVWVEGSAM